MIRENYVTVSNSIPVYKNETAHCTATGTVCERKVANFSCLMTM